MRRLELLLGSAFVLAGVMLPLLIRHWGANLEASIYTFVLCIGAAVAFLFFRRRAAEQQNEPAVATLFGRESVLSIAPRGLPGFEGTLPRQSDTLAPVIEMPAPVVAELQIEYSHNECDSPRLRSKPIVVKNITPGSDAFNVRLRSVQAPQNTLIFKPEVIGRLSGGGEVELIPQYEQVPGDVPRTSINQLPDFISGFYNPSGRTDLKALNEIYEEKSLMLEIEYESGGKQVVARCELLYTQWHKNIRMGRQEIRATSIARQSSVQ
jgi:hypothetical protein